MNDQMGHTRRPQGVAPVPFVYPICLSDLFIPRGTPMGHPVGQFHNQMNLEFFDLFIQLDKQMRSTQEQAKVFLSEKPAEGGAVSVAYVYLIKFGCLSIFVWQSAIPFSCTTVESWG